MSWEIVWSIVLGVIIGAVVSAITFLIIELWKLRNQTKVWLLNLYIEIDENRWKKVQEIKALYNEIQFTDSLTDNYFFDDFKCSYNVFYSILNKGINIDKNILTKYSDFISIEQSAYISKKEYFKAYFDLPPKGNSVISKIQRKKIKNHFRSFSLLKMIRHYEQQIIRISIIYNIVCKKLVELKIFKASELKNSVKKRKILYISYVGDQDDQIL